MANTVGKDNPLRYKGYYYDTETGLYYLQSRYYDPAIARFLNPDTVLNSTGETNGFSLYTYGANNPVLNEDSSGNIPVETVLDVASIGSSAYDLVTKPCWSNLGYLAWDVAAAAVPYAPGSYVAKSAKYAGKAAKAAKVAKAAKAEKAAKKLKASKAAPKVVKAKGKVAKVKIKILGKGSTGRTVAKNLKEQLAMKEVLSKPLKGAIQLKNIAMKDKRWLAKNGWVKMSKNVNGVEIHFVYNTKIKAFDDFKFK